MFASSAILFVRDGGIGRLAAPKFGGPFLDADAVDVRNLRREIAGSSPVPAITVGPGTLQLQLCAMEETDKL